MKTSFIALAALALVATATDVRCESLVSASAGQHAYLAVEYSDTLQGVQAMFAVRVCAMEDAPAMPAAHDGSPAPAQATAFIRETRASVPNEVLVRVMDELGREISRHEGVADVCGYARLASAFLVRDRSMPIETRP